MAKAPGLTREQIDAACALVEAGATFTAAAQQLGVGYGVVRYHMLRLGIASGRTRTQERALSRTVCFRDGRPVWRFTPAEDAKLLALEAQGISVAEIARRIGRRTSSVFMRLATLARIEAAREAAS